MAATSLFLQRLVSRNVRSLGCLRHGLTSPPPPSLRNIQAVPRGYLSTSAIPCAKKEWYEVTYERADGVTFTVQGKDGDNLLDIAVNKDIDLEGFGACEGTLACSTCHLVFKQADFDKIDDPCTDEEMDMLDLAYGLTDTETCVSLSGCGFLAVYLSGALDCLNRHASRLVQSAHFSGASSGAILAAAVVCGVPLNTVRAGFLHTAVRARQRPAGPFTPGFRIDEQLTAGLKSLPPDAHLRASGRLHVSVTRLRDGTNVLFSQWDSREDLIHTLRCSCFIVGFSGGRPPEIRGEIYVDGGYTNRLPSARPHTITISPYSGTADICPREGNRAGIVRWANLPMKVSYSNFVRLYRSLMPPPSHILNHYYHKGYNDALRFLMRQKMRRIC